MPDLLYLGNQLSRHGLNPTSVETLGERLTEDFVCVRGSDKKNPILRLLHMWFLVIQNRQARYLLLDTYSSQAFWYAITSAWLARLLNLAYIPILRGGNLPIRKNKSPKILLNYFKNAAHVVCTSGYLHSEMLAFYERDYELIPNYLDLENYPLYPKNPSSGIRLLWVRSFHKIYNPQLAIDVLVKLKEKGMDVELAMIGPENDGSLKKTRGYAEKMGVLQKVRFTGGLPKAKWIALSKDYNIFLNTTNVDNTPVSVMEAMALGFPVISTNVGGLPYLINSDLNGILTKPNDASGFVAEIERLHNDLGLFRSISLNARQSALNWDWENVRKKWIALLK